LEPKANLPSDHNTIYGGFLHKSIKRGNGASDCKQCHGQNLKGQVYNYNGTLVITQSCYECHADLWGGGGNK